ncbi:MAG: hypothetical protein LBD38_01355 [Streptococcaceae bacterium]|jgi:hypothetical protein|nr:hypothetical protein [Streptococcaceae bacterium]
MSLVGFHADFKNVCDYPVQISVPRYGDVSKPLDRFIAVGETVRVLNDVCRGSRTPFTIDAFVSPINELHRGCLPYDYLFEISANEKRISLDKEKFLEILKRSEIETQGKSTQYMWTISDPSLCPK